MSPDQALLHGVGDRCQVLHLARELLQEAGKDDQAGSQRKLVLHHQPAAVGQQHDDVDLREEADHLGVRRDPPEGPLLLICQASVPFSEPVDLVLFAGEALDHVDALNVLAQVEHHIVKEFSLSFVCRPHDTCEVPGQQEDCGCCRQTRQGQPSVDADHVYEVDGQTDR